MCERKRSQIHSWSVSSLESIKHKKGILAWLFYSCPTFQRVPLPPDKRIWKQKWGCDIFHRALVYLLCNKGRFWNNCLQNKWLELTCRLYCTIDLAVTDEAVMHPGRNRKLLWEDHNLNTEDKRPLQELSNLSSGACVQVVAVCAADVVRNNLSSPSRVCGLISGTTVAYSWVFPQKKSWKDVAVEGAFLWWESSIQDVGFQSWSQAWAELPCFQDPRNPYFLPLRWEFQLVVYLFQDISWNILLNLLFSGVLIFLNRKMPHQKSSASFSEHSNRSDLHP